MATFTKLALLARGRSRNLYNHLGRKLIQAANLSIWPQRRRTLISRIFAICQIYLCRPPLVPLAESGNGVGRRGRLSNTTLVVLWIPQSCIYTHLLNLGISKTKEGGFCSFSSPASKLFHIVTKNFNQIQFGVRNHQ